MSPLSYFRRSVVAFPLAALAALAMFVISEVSYQDATSALDSLGDRATARNRLNQVAKSLLDAETGQRGYLLSNRQAYLDPYRDAQDGLHEATAWLTRYYAADPHMSALMKDLSTAVTEKMSELATSIDLHDKGSDRAWRDLLLSDIGKEKMERVRTLTEQLLAEESAQVAKGRKGVYQTLMLNRIGTTAMAAVSLLALFMYLRQTAALDRHTEAEARRVESERDRLEAEVTARTRQLKELAQHLQTIREDERSRLARELHDELGALLTAAKLDAARLKSRLGKTTPEVLERIAHLNETLNGGIALKRRIIEDLRPSSLSNLGLVAALEILIREFAQRSEIAVSEDFEHVDLNPAAQLTVYRLVQEALTNIAKYAKATQVNVTLAGLDEQQVRVAVQDNGVGFDSETQRSASHGLIGMRYRVEADGGSMRLVSAPGQGTLIEAILPASYIDSPAPSDAPPEPVPA
ncbi:MAG: CHASE3 domain-containing protein [Burkholderiales bacterium]|nr:CHASE3 domain-containing protein [Burkholderiales bacterium]